MGLWVRVTICEVRYGSGWVAFACESDEVPALFNGGDADHLAFCRAAHPYPMGCGMTPDQALAALLREQAAYRADSGGYRCCLDAQRWVTPPVCAS